MIPQMKAEEITTSDMEKNIFYGPIRNFPKSFSQAQKEKNFQHFIKMLLPKRSFRLILKWEHF